MRLPSRAALAVALAGAALTAQDDPLAAQLKANVFKAEGQDPLPYRLFTPKGAIGGKRRFPLVLFLHGAGERGTDNRAQLRHGVADFVAHQGENPCFVLAPQCKRSVYWDHHYESLLALTKRTIAKPAVDPNRVYITGLSMGGFATWHALARDPGLFAAALPICGGGLGTTARRLAARRDLADLPVWVVHGDKDRVVPLQRSKEMVDILRKLGNEPRFTIYQGVGHNAWTRTYRDPAIHAWLFSQVRKTPLAKGDRIVFFGDSITAAGARKGGFIRLIEADLRAHHAELGIELLGAGVSGNKVRNLQERLDRDVLAKRPTIVILYIGINDVWHWKRKRGTKKSRFDAGLRNLIARIREANARVLLCTPSVIGERRDGANEFDAMLSEYAAISRRVARDTGTELLDLRTLFLKHLRTHNPENARQGILTRDTVHLNARGNRFVADAMLSALGVPRSR